MGLTRRGRWLAATAPFAAIAAGLGVSAFTGAAADAAGPTAAMLGDEAHCGSYSGRPAGWGLDARAGMRRVPGGEFQFGSTRGYADERPASGRPVPVASFWMDTTEVTVAQFADF